VGTALAVMRGAAPPECVESALRSRAALVTPMAPEHGLFLDEAFYDGYNQRFGQLHQPLDFGQFRAQAEAFRVSHVLPHVARQDWREMPFALWLRTLHEHSFGFSTWAAGGPGWAGAGGGGGGALKRQRLEALDVRSASAGMVVAAQERYGLGRPQQTPRKAAEAAAVQAEEAAAAGAAAAVSARAQQQVADDTIADLADGAQ
jgi:hypothetical protein